MRRSTWCTVSLLAIVACGPTERPAGIDAGPCPEGERRCDGNTFQVCTNGDWSVVDQCALYCTLDGCSSCQGPGCVSDACTSPSADQSNLGCEYWAVDLDNAIEVWGVIGEPLGQGFTMTQSFTRRS